MVTVKHYKPKSWLLLWTELYSPPSPIQLICEALTQYLRMGLCLDRVFKEVSKLKWEAEDKMARWHH